VPKCPLCEREVPELMEKHHLRTQKTDKKDTIRVCRECHKTIHTLFGNNELRNPALELDTLDGLMANERFFKAVKFIRKVPPGQYMKAKESKHRKRKR